MNENDYKYVIGDFSSTSIAARYTYEEILMHDRVPFKFQSIITIYILREMKVINPEIEFPEKLEIGQHLLELKADNLIYDVYKRLKIKVKFSYPQPKGGYKIRNLKLEAFKDFADENDINNIFIQEINISNLALMSFSV